MGGRSRCFEVAVSNELENECQKRQLSAEITANHRAFALLCPLGNQLARENIRNEESLTSVR